VASWMKQNGWALIVSVIGVVLAFGQYQQRQAYLEIAQAGIVQRVEALEAARADERGRLDAVYVLREVAIAQNTAILNRLDELKADVQEVRRAVR
jgi:hypothetical protein